MKIKRIIIFAVIAIVVALAITLGLNLASKKKQPGTITSEPIVVTVNPTTPEGEDIPEPMVQEPIEGGETGTEDPDTSDNPDADPKPIVQQGERELVNFETDPAKIVIPDDTHDELEIRVKAIADDEFEGDDFEENGNLGSEGMENSGNKKSSSEGPNVGLLILLAFLLVALGGVFIYMNKLKNGGGKKKY